jgi:hypothetical protein
MRRVVIHEILIGAGLALLLVAGLTTGVAQRSLGRYERDAASLRARLDTLVAQGRDARQEVLQTARTLEEAEFNVRATRELRARLWRPGGMGMMATVAGVAALGAGALVRRRRRAAG